MRLHICILALALAAPLRAQTSAPVTAPADYSSRVTFHTLAPSQLPGPTGLREYLVDGKLRLALDDAIRLCLLNNTDVRIDQSAVDVAKFNLLAAYHPFDPLFTSNASALRQTTPATSQLQGASTVSSLFQQMQFGYTQTLETGTNYNASYTGNKSDTNSSFFFINPYFSSGLNFQVTQPLLRNRGLFPNRAPIVIARRNLSQSEATFEAQVSNEIQNAVGQYWAVVGARENLRVQQDSLDEAEATYKQNKRALELGALPPLDIYRSESQVAQRRVSLIQAQYALKQAEDQFRETIGADLDPYTAALDLDLTENPEPHGQLFTTDVATALDTALQHRPELDALRLQVANDDTGVRLARNGLRPDLELAATYASNGVGGPQLDSSVTPPVVVPGGFGDALSQNFRFRFPTYGFTLSLNLPVRNRAAEAALGEASVAKRTDLYAIRRQQQSIRLDVVNSVHQLEEAKLSLEASKIARSTTQKVLESEQRKYELGAGDIFKVLEAQTELTQAEVSQVQAQINYQLALTAVRHSTGELLAGYRVQVQRAVH
ncbi:MAG TPA: TolC family protein [Terriglobia bacterium]|nr:TolC family protein [Terriglobia bacterium]